jgi:hypothetical protein
MEQIHEVTLTFKLPHGIAKVFKRNFPKFCEKNFVTCEITSEIRWYWYHDKITIVVTGTAINCATIEDTISKMLQFVI